MNKWDQARLNSKVSFHIARCDFHGADTGHVDDGGIEWIRRDFDSYSNDNSCAWLLKSRLGEGSGKDDVFGIGTAAAPIGKCCYG